VLLSASCGGGEIRSVRDVKVSMATQLSSIPYSSPSSTPESAASQEVLVNSKGINLTLAIPEVTEARLLEEPASPLEDKNDKPDYVRPRHIKLDLSGPYAKKHERSTTPLGIEILPIEEYREACIKSDALRNLFDHDIDVLQSIISRKPRTIEDLPYLPVCDCKEQFFTHVRYLKFNGGEGVLTLMHTSVEKRLVANRGLSYQFRGFTNDGKYFIYGVFPVSSKLLPEDERANEFRGYKLPDYFYDPGKQVENAAAYRAYIQSVKNLLANQSADEFEPSLNLIEKTMSSLEIDQIEWMSGVM
jgi:hypothetical protein